MSKIRCVGEQNIFRIVAEFGGNAEKILRKIVSHAQLDSTTVQSATGWENDANVLVSKVNCDFAGTKMVFYCVLTRNIGNEQKGNHMGGLFLEESSQYTFMRVKYPIVYIPARDLGYNALRNIREELVAAVKHGSNWKNKDGDIMETPFGRIETNRRKNSAFLFQKEEPTTLETIRSQDLMHASPHIGDWAGGATRLIPASLGIPMILDEWRDDGAHKQSHIGTLAGVNLSDDIGVWGPYMDWATNAPEGFRKKASSPFALHVSEMKRLYPESQISSSAWLNYFSREGLKGFFTKLLYTSPARFARLFDENGTVHRLVRAQSNMLVYEDGFTMCINRVVENVLDTLGDLYALEADSLFVLPCIPRVMIDVATSFVLDSVIHEQKGHSHCMSGSAMSEYLFEDTPKARGLRTQCDTVYTVLQESMNDLPQTLQLHVYPLEASLHVSGSQYDESLRKEIVQKLYANV